MSDTGTKMIYDDVFWTCVSKMSRYIIPLINEVFGRDYSMESDVILLPMKQVTPTPDSSPEEGEVDYYARIINNCSQSEDLFHFECQSTTDGSIIIRVAEYAAGTAYSNVIQTEDGAEMTLPHSAVIQLRHPIKKQDYYITVNYPGGQIKYQIPVIRIGDYSIDELFDKGLLILVPFCGFTIEKLFKDMDCGKGDLTSLGDMMERLVTHLEEMEESGEINNAESTRIYELTKSVFKKLTEKYSNLSKGVEQVMGGHIIKTKADEILEQGEKKGQQEATKLMNFLWSNGRGEDAVRASNDEIFLKKLISDFNNGLLKV